MGSVNGKVALITGIANNRLGAELGPSMSARTETLVER